MQEHAPGTPPQPLPGATVPREGPGQGGAMPPGAMQNMHPGPAVGVPSGTTAI